MGHDVSAGLGNPVLITGHKGHRVLGKSKHPVFETEKFKRVSLDIVFFPVNLYEVLNIAETAGRLRMGQEIRRKFPSSVLADFPHFSEH